VTFVNNTHALPDTPQISKLA